MQYGWQVVGLLPNIVLCFIYINKLHKLSHSWHCIVELYKFIQCKYVNACARNSFVFVMLDFQINNTYILVKSDLLTWSMKDFVVGWRTEWINKSASKKLNKGYINLVMFFWNLTFGWAVLHQRRSILQWGAHIWFCFWSNTNIMFYKYSKILRYRGKASLKRAQYSWHRTK